MITLKDIDENNFIYNAPVVFRGPEYKGSILRVDIKHGNLKGFQ